MGRPRHPDKHIEKAIKYAEAKGWRVVMSNGHAWGRLLCPFDGRGGHAFGVWSAPTDPEGFARSIIRRVDQCTHEREEP